MNWLDGEQPRRRRERGEHGERQVVVGWRMQGEEREQTMHGAILVEPTRVAASDRPATPADQHRAAQGGLKCAIAAAMPLSPVRIDMLMRQHLRDEALRRLR